MPLKRVAIVGKTNVGKSQLFNRIVGEKHSVVLESPGITRDRITLVAAWLKYKFYLTDTGGYDANELSVDFQEDINKQTIDAIEESDLIIFLISKKDGITQSDVDIANILKLKKYKDKKVVLAINKCDAVKHEDHSYSQISLGFGEGINISAEHGINIGDLLDAVVEKLNVFNPEVIQKPEENQKFAIIGRPNVGKSSLCNALLQNERLIVSPVAGTTRDAVDIVFSYQGKKHTLIDTPGIKKNKIINTNRAEYISILRAKQSVKRADVICIVVDVSVGITEMDEKIAGLAFKANIPTLIIGNKWDLIDYKSDSQRQDLVTKIKANLFYLHWAPTVLISAKESKKIDSIFKTLDLINQEASKQFSTIDLKNFLIKVIAVSTIPRVKNHKVVLYSMKQVKSKIPTFIIACNNIDYLHFSFERMLENKFRESFNLFMSPIKIYYRSKK